MNDEQMNQARFAARIKSLELANTLSGGVGSITAEELVKSATTIENYIMGGISVASPIVKPRPFEMGH